MSPMPLRPANDDREGWKKFWEAQGQSWRTEPDIDGERQKYLDERRRISIISDSIPFKDIELSRADVEWLLATHENIGGHGPINWSDESQRERAGLDLRGANLCKINLIGLPLAKLIGSRSLYKEKQYNPEAIRLEGASLVGAHLEHASLINVHLEGADLHVAHLECSLFIDSHLEKANLSDTFLQGTVLVMAHLEGADLSYAHLEGADLHYVHLEGANLSEAFFDSTTRLNEAVLSNSVYGGVSLADVHWGDVNVAVIDWSAVSQLGDERTAKQQKSDDGEPKDSTDRLAGYRKAVRAYRQLAVMLRNQGLNEDAARFAYRAQLTQRVVFRQQKKRGQYLFSLFLDLLAGYGYKPWRSFATYIVVICLFATIYFLLGHHLAWNEVIVISMTAFHGRGFFPTQFQPGDPQALVAAIEAFVGLLIEVTFIATLTQRLFGK
jgi:uncharacterized protein YjbI with pentapeptide repeats